MVPSLKIRPECDLHRIVQDFCDRTDEVGYYDLGTPWVVDGKAYGADGRAGARIACEDAGTATDSRRLPDDINDIWERCWTERGKWRPMPPERLIEHRGPCPECCEIPRNDCETCHGSGFTEDLKTCMACRGSGYKPIECAACDGRRWGMYPNLQAFGHKRICVSLLRKVQRIPGAMWNIGGIAKDTPILIKSDVGVDVLVMPVVPR